MSEKLALLWDSGSECTELCVVKTNVAERKWLCVAAEGMAIYIGI